MTTPTPVIAPDDPMADDVRALLTQHLNFAHSNGPPESVHALDVSGLLDDSVSFYSLRDGGELLAVGALRMLDAGHPGHPGHAEIKSMHTAQAARGRGLGRAMLRHLLGVARERGVRRVSLETGTVPAFAPARALYASAGFRPCGPFGDYKPMETSTFMTLELGPDGSAPAGPA
ncbi:MAG TPA: GNAT family N-acetyltransferase [Streptosporangiaceae bacterium]|nr:GNAT family N-acetyltransferase [Streptosporangiaceae bacterium]